MRKSRKPSLAKASIEERKSSSHSALEYFLRLLWRLWELGRKLFSFWASEDNKEPSLSLERPDAASSSSARSTPPVVSVAAERASEEQTEGLAGEILSFGINDKDACDYPNWTGHSNEVLTLDREVLEAEFSRSGVLVGEIFCPDQVGYRKLDKEAAIVDSLERLPLEQIEDDEIKYERSGSDSEDWKKRYHDEKEILNLNVELRQVVSNYEKKPEGKIMNAGVKIEVLKLPAAKKEKIDVILVNASCTRILRTMFFQGANIDLKSEFEDITWRTENRFPKFSNDDADYLW